MARRASLCPRAPSTRARQRFDIVLLVHINSLARFRSIRKGVVNASCKCSCAPVNSVRAAGMQLAHGACRFAFLLACVA